jgi:acetolactate synthase-1/2/3 large subunit
MHGGDRVAQELERQGVRCLFTLCGGHISPILVGCKRRGIRVVDVRDEATAAFAADGMARLTGVPGVAAVTAGPGVTNAITAVMNARLAQSPFVLLGGATATLLKGRGSLQDIDQLALFRPQVKWLASARRVADLAFLVRRAFEEARRGVPGPVFVELPVDLLYEEATVRQWFAAAAPPPGKGGLRGKAMRWYLQRHARRLFRDPGVLPEEREDVAGSLSARSTLAPQPGAVDKLQEIVAGAERPVLVLGSQCVLDTQQVAQTATAVATLGLPVYLAGMARGLLGGAAGVGGAAGAGSRQYRHHRKVALREADLVVLAGVPCDFRLEYGNHIGRGAAYVAVNRSRQDLRKNRRPNLGLHADPAATLRLLAEGFAADAKRLAPWLAQLDEREAAREREIAAQAAAPPDGVDHGVHPGVNPLRFFRELDALLDERSVLIADGGDFVATASYIVRPRRPLAWLDPGVFGTLGVGAGFSIAAALASENPEVWTIWGDGAFGFAISEIDTFVRHGLPVIGLVGNDAAWTQIAREQVDMLGDDVGTVLAPTDYHRVAEGFGAAGLEISRDDEIRDGLLRARQLAATGKPVIVNVRLGKTAFRKGSLSM